MRRKSDSVTAVMDCCHERRDWSGGSIVVVGLRSLGWQVRTKRVVWGVTSSAIVISGQ